MNKFTAFFALFFVLLVIAFGTWQMFCGNFEAAFTSIPFLIIFYFFIRPGQNST